MTFEAMGLDAHLIRALKAQEISEPTPIQAQAIPAALEGRDIMGIAQTGTGKTAAFGLPMAHNLMQMKGKPQAKTTRGLILAPTRELAKQIANNVIAYVKGTRLRVNLVVGGASIRSQVNRLDRGTDLLVATPGRLIDLIERGAIYLDQSRYLVLDEADQMLDLGFIHALRQIAPLLPAERQTMLFSATMPKLMGELADAYLKDPQRIEVSPPGRTAEKVIQELHYVDQSEKADLLVQHLNAHPDDLSIVFTRTKHGADKLLRVLEAKGFEATTVHGNKSQGQRERAIKAFAAGHVQVLVATDVAARGLDIPGVRHVYNFDLPNVPDNYVHRIGRTARAGRDGRAVVYCARAEMSELRAVQKTIGLEIPVLSGERWQGGGAEGGKGKSRRGRPGGRPGGHAGGRSGNRFEGRGRNEGGRNEGGRHEGEERQGNRFEGRGGKNHEGGHKRRAEGGEGGEFRRGGGKPGGFKRRNEGGEGGEYRGGGKPGGFKRRAEGGEGGDFRKGGKKPGGAPKAKYGKPSRPGGKPRKQGAHQAA